MINPHTPEFLKKMLRFFCRIRKKKCQDKIEEVKELIEFLAVSPVKHNNREETAIKMISDFKAELEYKQDLIMQEEFETGEILSDLHSKKLEALDELHVKEIELEK